ncbi:MAG: cysteine hydrolase [Nitrososphaerales archaeon]
MHDMQKFFLQEAIAKPEMAEVLKKVRSLIDLSHSLSMPCIYTQYVRDPDMPYPKGREQYLAYGGTSRMSLMKGSTGAEILDELKPTSKDFIMTKYRSSAFYGTILDTLLRSKGVWILILVGGNTNWGLEWMARDANTLDLVPVALRDCTYSPTPEAQSASLANIDSFIGHVMNYDEVVKTLSG